AVDPDAVKVGEYTIEYRIEGAEYVQHGLITGVNTFAQHLSIGGRDAFMLFSGAPIRHGHAIGYYVYGGRDTGAAPPDLAEGLAGGRGAARWARSAGPAPHRRGRAGARHDSISPGRPRRVRPAPGQVLQVRAGVSPGGPSGRLTAVPKTLSAAEVDAFRARLC